MSGEVSPEETLARELALAAALGAYPDDATLEVLAGLPLAASPSARGFAEALSRADGPAVVRAAYIDLFDRGRTGASPYETEYGRMRGMSKGNELADLSGFYRAFGLELDAERAHEVQDHVAVELEFYTVLLLKQAALARLGDTEGGEIVRDARRRFLGEHLAPLALALAARPAVKDDPLYGPLFAWCGEALSRECEALGVAPAPLDFFDDPDAGADVACATGPRLPVLPS
ncbi:MAG: molecular chaperone TorD family protein [Polyangiaceae bacterium]|nr:molecular chaperone TorD family protein [Polyangiaceae bacterium]